MIFGWKSNSSIRARCDPAAGGYAHPADACAALVQYAHLVHHRPPNVCMCPMMFGIPGRAYGVLAGHPVQSDKLIALPYRELSLDEILQKVQRDIAEGRPAAN